MLPWPEALSPERCSVARWRHLTITVPGHIIILIIRAPIMLLRRPAITLRAMALRQVETQSPTACNASGLTIRGAERILGQTAVAIHALERCETGTCKLAMDGLDLTVRRLVSQIEIDDDFGVVWQYLAFEEGRRPSVSAMAGTSPSSSSSGLRVSMSVHQACVSSRSAASAASRTATIDGIDPTAGETSKSRTVLFRRKPLHLEAAHLARR